VVDFERLPDAAAAFRCDVVFCALGTTIRDAGSEAAFAHVDRDYVAAAARLAREAGQFLLVTALGADPRARIFYNRVKGEAERDVITEGPPTVSIFRPSLLAGHRDEQRRGEVVMGAVLGFVRPLLVRGLRKYRPTPADAVARAMVAVAARGPSGMSAIYEADEIMAIAAGATA
jgi:uncharacterized protein YbjT (DUF2867 family)